MAASTDDLKNLLERIDAKLGRAEADRQQANAAAAQKTAAQSQAAAAKATAAAAKKLADATTKQANDRKKAAVEASKQQKEQHKRFADNVSQVYKSVGSPGSAIVDKFKSTFQGVKSGIDLAKQIKGGKGSSMFGNLSSLLGGGAGAGGEAAAAGGAEEAVAGGVAAGPPGWIALAVAGVAAFTAALAATPGIIQNFAESVLQSNFALAEFSGQMAAVKASHDVYNIRRSQRVGAATAGSANNLENAWQSLSNALEPITTLLTNLSNDGLAVIVDLTAIATKLVVLAAGPLISILQYLGGVLKQIIEFLQTHFGFALTTNQVKSYFGDVNDAHNMDRGELKNPQPKPPRPFVPVNV